MIDMMHVYSTCPRCKSGIMQPSAIVNIEGAMKIEQLKDLKQAEGNVLLLNICTLDICGYTEFIASPSILSTLKKQKHFYYARM